MKLTQTRLESLRCPAGKRDMLVFDDEQRGLAVRVTATGGKTYLTQYTFQGQKRRIPLGSTFAISLPAARDAARVIMGEVAKGADPAAERKQAQVAAEAKAARDAMTFNALLGDWSALHLANKRPGYAAEAVRALRYAFGPHLDQPAEDLDRQAVVKTLDAIVRRGNKAMAARLAAYGRAAYGWAAKRGSVMTNPFLNLPVAPTVKRARVLTDEELAAVWRAAGAGAFGRIVRMLILTGQRRDEVAGMTWDELSGGPVFWTIPAARAKNGADHIVPLSPVARDHLQGPNPSPYVFPGKRGQFSGWSKCKARLDARSGVTGWRLHDLRRTVATGLQRLGTRIEVTEQILNHVSGSRAGIVGVYQRHDFAEEKRAALDLWGDHVARLVAENKRL